MSSHRNAKQLRELDIERESLKFGDLSREQLIRKLGTLSLYSREQYRKAQKLRKQLSELRPPKQTKVAPQKRAKK